MLVRPHPSDREPGILTDKKEGRGGVPQCSVAALTNMYVFISLVLSTLTGTIRFLKKRDFLIHFQNSMVCVCVCYLWHSKSTLHRCYARGKGQSVIWFYYFLYRGTKVDVEYPPDPSIV